MKAGRSRQRLTVVGSIFDGVAAWSEISLDHLYFAYRKAKFEAFRQKPMMAPLAWAAYEADLGRHLARLLRRLHKDPHGTVAHALCTLPVLQPKGLKVETSDVVPKSIYSDEFERFGAIASAARVHVAVRVVGIFSPEAHLLSALWILTCGASLTRTLGDCAYANRISTNFRSPRLFVPYMTAFERWRTGGLRAARGELEAGAKVAILSSDVSSFYHSIDPLPFGDKKFHALLGWSPTQFQRSFTSALVAALDQTNSLWTKSYPQVRGLGVPIGLPASGVLANAVLAPLDAKLQALTPCWYGRYVDDIVIVLRLEQVERLVARDQPVSLPTLLPDAFRIREGAHELHFGDAWGRSALSVQPEKERLFRLRGAAGERLLRDIDAEIGRASSEFRFGADDDAMDAVRVLTSANEVGEAPLSPPASG